jgi:hypothetical protein
MTHSLFSPYRSGLWPAGVIDYIYEDGHLPSAKSIDIFFDIGIKTGRFKERWPLTRFSIPTYVDSYSQWRPVS